jgi:hypothetical protein
MVFRRSCEKVSLAGLAAEAKSPMMMANKTELAAALCATILRLAHELLHEWMCSQVAVAFFDRTCVGCDGNPARCLAST